MGKGSLPPIFEAGLKELSRRGRSDSALNKTADSSAASTNSARKSIMPLSRLVSFRRISSAVKGPPQHDKKPLLHLNLSSQSFLDSIVVDDSSKKPLYTIKTDGPTTRVTRNIRAPTQFCTVRWPKVLPTTIKGKMVSDGVSIHIGDARWIGSENLLQRGSRPDSSRKFQLPNYSQQLKWKRYGSVCWCTTATVAGPVAILDLARDRLPTRLTIYETLHDKYDTKGVLSYHGVYIPLVDYLLVTAMLLVTDLQEWMLVTQVEGAKNIIIPNPTSGDGETVETTTSDVQWRKILYREPLFPRINCESSSSYTADSESAMSPATPISARNGSGHNRVYSQPSTIPAGASILSFSDDGYDHGPDDERSTVRRPLSPAMESQHYPGDEAPRHSYADPSYHYRKSISAAVPPVPPLPAEYQMSNRSLPIPLPSSPSSPARPLRRLPVPPPIREGHLTFGASSSASDSRAPSTYTEDSATTPTSSVSAVNTTTTPSTAPVQRTRSMSNARRPLPHIPPMSPGPNTHIIRRSRSDVLLSEEYHHHTVPDYTSTPRPQPPPLPPVSQPISVMSPPPSARSISGRSLPPTPRVTSADPASPHPDMMQEELRAAAFTVRAIRQQQQHLDQLQHQQHQPHTLSRHGGHGYGYGRVDVLSPILPSPHGSHKSEEEDIENWVRILSSPADPTSGGRGGGEFLPNGPPPAYNSLSFQQSSPLSGGL